jgi:hypothetical protein
MKLHDLPGAARSFARLSIPDCKQDVAVLRDENACLQIVQIAFVACGRRGRTGRVFSADIRHLDDLGRIAQRFVARARRAVVEVERVLATRQRQRRDQRKPPRSPLLPPTDRRLRPATSTISGSSGNSLRSRAKNRAALANRGLFARGDVRWLVTPMISGTAMRYSSLASASTG